MDYEKLYNEALERAKYCLTSDMDNSGHWAVKHIFPELKESEYERIRKEIIRIVDIWTDSSPVVNGIPRETLLAWLEKQGEQPYWKPSEEQLQTLHAQLNEGAVTYPEDKRILFTLYEDLMKIMIQEEKQGETFTKKDVDDAYLKGISDAKDELKKQGVQRYKFNIGDVISNGQVVYRVENITKNCIGQDCYFLVNMKSEKIGMRYLLMSNSRGNTSHFGETTWLCEQVDKLFEKQAEQKPILEVFGFKVGDAVRLKDGDGRKHIIKSFEEVEGIHGHNFYQVEFEDNSARDGIYPGEEYPNGYYTQMEKFEKEQNPVDEAEPKFKVEKGKWYVCIKDLFDNYENKAFCEGDIYLCTQDGKLIPSNSNVPYEVTCPDTYFRDWTIQDAKDGDVLINGSNIFIFHFINDTRLMGYCHVNTDDKKFYDDIDKIECFCLIDAVVRPATKNQRDFLFQKMKEAGYEWDSEKKDLKIIDWSKHIKYEPNGPSIIEEKSTWSKDDERMFSGLTSIVEDWYNSMSEKEKEYYGDCGYINWLKSIKDRVQSNPKQCKQKTTF